MIASCGKWNGFKGPGVGGHPLAERFGLRLVRAKDNTVQAGFVDEPSIALTSRGEAEQQPGPGGVGMDEDFQREPGFQL